MNVHFSDACRKYNKDVPVFLHNRPRDFVQHVSNRWTSAHDIPAANISQLDERSFRVISADSSNTYVVSFGSSSDASMPHCDCYDWRKYHWPCKYLCAIFLHVTSHSWNSLAADYRDSPHFRIDNDLFHSQDGVPTTSPAAVTDVSDGAEANDVAAEAAVSEKHSVTPTCSSSASAKRCREVLRELTDLTYLSTDVCSLTVLHEQLQVALSTLKRSIPQDAGLLLEYKNRQMFTRVQRCRLRNIPTRRAKSKARRARPSVAAPVVEEPPTGTQAACTTTYCTLESAADLDVTDWVTDSAAPVAEEPLMGTQPAVATTYSTLESSADLDVRDRATDSAAAHTDEGVPASKRARFDGPHPVSSIRYYFKTNVAKRKCNRTSDLQCSDTEGTTARLEAQRSHLACAVLLSEHELAPRPSKKLIMATLRQPADGCLGISISQSDFLTLLPGQWLSDNVSVFLQYGLTSAACICLSSS